LSSWLPANLLVPVGLPLALAWALGCFACLAFVVDAGVAANTALLCDLHRRSLPVLDVRPQRYSLLFAAASAAASGLFQLVCLLSPRPLDGLALAAGHLCGTVGWVHGVLPALLRRQASQTAAASGSGQGTASLATRHLDGASPRLRACHAAGAVAGSLLVVPLYGLASLDPRASDDDRRGLLLNGLLWAALCVAWAAALGVWVAVAAREVAASAACDDAGGGGGWDGIELASDAVDRNVQAAAAAAAAASSAVARAVVGSVDGPPVRAYTFLTLVNTQYDDEVGGSRWLPPILRAALLFFNCLVDHKP
jgi:hypothetical protein